MINLYHITFLLFCLGSFYIEAQGESNPGRKITIMHVTDGKCDNCTRTGFMNLIIPRITVHGWIAGHPHNPFLNADFGDFASFVEHTSNLAQSEGREFFLFDSGDIIEGTGISDATKVHGVHIFPVIMKIPHYTGLTIGNHGK